MIVLNAHFDGKVIVPDEPLNLPPNQKVRIELEPIETPAPLVPKPLRILGQQPGVVTFLAPDWDAPLPDDIWDHNKEDESKP
ncbi:MAG TPA: hypothetical protein VFE58_00250 [Tepidisphaeraceae bacterium]|nr:hypothetical protein [Tepidisphaeraceae bacterium]